MITIEDSIGNFSQKYKNRQNSTVAVTIADNIPAPHKTTKAVVIPAAGPIKLVKEKGVIKTKVQTHTLRKAIRVRKKRFGVVCIILWEINQVKIINVRNTSTIFYIFSNLWLILFITFITNSGKFSG
jgi:hypothetical protein